MKFKLELDCDNSAFCVHDENNNLRPEPQWEIARILEEAAQKVRDGNREGILLDANGHLVGKYKITGRR